ncbi:hypothetical protein [Amycolatopsis minnesotensis]|uniref:Uncharacterized protein n=1 Tax=Amycolatopsis minnesotensis TaxID=337894 RepID=A0ABN2SL30_9PSEU
MADEFKFDDQQPPPSDTGGGDEALPVDGFFDMSGIVDGDKAKAMNKTAHELKGIAKKGGFAINQAGFDTYTNLCRKFIDNYGPNKRRLEILQKNAPLGDFPYANAVATFNVQVADGSPDSLIPNLELMADGYRTMLETLEIAKKNYDESDHEAKINFAKLNQEST